MTPVPAPTLAGFDLSTPGRFSVSTEALGTSSTRSAMHATIEQQPLGADAFFNDV